jgi:hypothetical protein
MIERPRAATSRLGPSLIGLDDASGEGVNQACKALHAYSPFAFHPMYFSKSLRTGASIILMRQQRSGDIDSLSSVLLRYRSTSFTVDDLVPPFKEFVQFRYLLVGDYIKYSKQRRKCSLTTTIIN